MKRIKNVQKGPSELFLISHYSDLLKKANTYSIETRWKRQLVTEVYQAINGLILS